MDQFHVQIFHEMIIIYLALHNEVSGFWLARQFQKPLNDWFNLFCKPFSTKILYFSFFAVVHIPNFLPVHKLAFIWNIKSRKDSLRYLNLESFAQFKSQFVLVGNGLIDKRQNCFYIILLDNYHTMGHWLIKYLSATRGGYCIQWGTNRCVWSFRYQFHSTLHP